MKDKDWQEAPFFSDKTGRNVRVGDYIVYGHALGRCAGLRFGKVLSIKSKEEQRWHREPETVWSIRVIGVDDDWAHKSMELNQRVGTLGFPDRIVQINELIHQDVKDLLDTWREKGA